MRRRDVAAFIGAVAGGVLGVSPAASTGLAYKVSIADASSGVVEVSFELSDFPYDETDIVLARAAAGADSYYSFFVDERFTTASDRELIPGRSTPGVVHLSGIAGSLIGYYRVLVSDLEAALGSSVHSPLLSGARMILPLESILAEPAEIDTKGLEFTTLSVSFDLPEGWSLLNPYRAYRGEISFAETGISALRSAIVAAGAFEIRNDLEGETGSLRIFAGGSPADIERVDATLTKLITTYTNLFATRGTEPMFIVVEMDAAEGAALDRGSSLRVRCNSVLSGGDPATWAYGTPGYTFWHLVAHEMIHRWIGASGMVVPLGGEIYWLNEGAADYVATITLPSCGIGTPDAALAFLSETATRYRALAARADAVDGTRAKYESDRAYRELVLTKGPLICYLLDTQLLRSEPGGAGFAAAIRQMFYGAFLRDRRIGAFFSEAELSRAMSTTLGMRGQLLVSGLVRSDLYADLLERGSVVGLSATEGPSGEVAFTFASPDALYRRLLETGRP